MHLHVIKRGFALGLTLLALACNGAGGDPAAPTATETTAQADIPAGPPADAPRLGLMTSLPLYWPMGAEIGDIAGGSAAKPWQRTAIETRYNIVPLDTLSPIAGLSPGDPETDPLEGIDRLAVVQPRGLSPADNVALDEWVRGGGHLLLVLDPMLTGAYEAALGDPRRPADTALIPPVVGRWGLEVSFDEEQETVLSEAKLGSGHVWLSVAGRIAATPAAAASCKLFVNATIAQCRVGEGWATVVADAASFEHAPGDVENSQAKMPPLVSLLDFALRPENTVNSGAASK